MPGVATIRAILGYCGKSFSTLENGAWIDVYGWLDTQTRDFPKLSGPACSAAATYPILIAAARFAGVKTVSFHAGFASATCHKVVERLALLVKNGQLKSAVPFAHLLYTLGRWLKPLFSDRGAMFVRIEGLHHANGAPHALTWNLIARENHGPQIPCAAAIALANKLASGENSDRRNALHGTADVG